MYTITSKHNNTKILERKYPQVFSSLYNTSPSLCTGISAHPQAHCKGFLLRKFKDDRTEQLVVLLSPVPFFLHCQRGREQYKCMQFCGGAWNLDLSATPRQGES